MAKVKIMNYNVWRGFHTFDHVFQQERLDAARRVVAREQPDILALTEAWYADRVAYQQVFDFPYGHVNKFPSFQNGKEISRGNALLSRYPLEARSVFLPHRSGVHGCVALEQKILHIEVVHLPVLSTEQEKIQVMQSLFPMPHQNYLITGDFNALSPEDQGYARESMIQEVSQDGVHIKHPEQFIDELLKREFIAWILQQGLRDAFEKRESRVSTVPTRVKYGRNVKGMRVDYFFISPRIAVEDAYVVKNEDAELASDHYPIVGTFEC